ncbi:MAG: hypothetical protein V4463_19740 [Pseudomonadota bacterium]
MKSTLLLVLLCQAALPARAACEPIKLGFIDQSRPPYYMGSGAVEAKPPGAGVELLREAAASAGCAVTTVRMPQPRLRTALETGALDAVPIDAVGHDLEAFAFPLDHQGLPDKDKAMRLWTVVFVRAADKVPRDADPLQYFKGKRLGLTHGAPYAQQFRDAGIIVDDGAVDSLRNLDKIKLGRVDGFAIALAGPTDMDTLVASRFGGELVRLDKPLRMAHVWMALSHSWQARNKEAADAMWSWFGANGSARFRVLLKKYDTNQP